MEKNKSFCEVCKIQVPSSYLHKHLTSERHLRAKAAKMFYQSKTNNKNPYKRSKYSEEITPVATKVGGLQDSGFVTSIGRIKNVWVLMRDLSTGKAVYKNKLNGRTQSNRPVGLTDEDVHEEAFESVIVDDYEKVNYGKDEEFEQKEIGEWVDTSEKYWFGGSDKEESEEQIKDEKEFMGNKRFERDDSISGSEEVNDQMSDSDIESKDGERNREPLGTIEATELLKKQMETKEIDEEIIEKPVFQEFQTSAVFKKRNIKGKSNIMSL